MMLFKLMSTWITLAKKHWRRIGQFWEMKSGYPLRYCPKESHEKWE